MNSVIEETEKDYFMSEDGIQYAGKHLIIDIHNASSLNDITLMEAVFRECVEVSGATLLHIHLHHFTCSGGITGVAALSESHISVHTWPERRFAAFDVFMCGGSQPEKVIPVIKKAFNPESIDVKEIKRGL